MAAIDAILTQATKPTNLNLETCGGNVNLSWTASTAPAGYCIYRDNVQVGTTTETSYTDENVGTGKHVYYVRANDNSGHQSIHSNSVLCTVEPYATVPEDLTIEWDGSFADLDWEASSVSNTLSSAELYFSDDPYTAYGGDARSTVYWGMCFNPEELRQYKGMSIDQVSIPVYATGIAYTLRIYRGTTYGNTTGAPVYTQSFTPISGGWNYQTMTLTNPYALDDITQDLWITFSATLGNSEGYPAVVGEYGGPSSNCFYMGDGTSVNDLCWSHVPDFGSDYNYAVCIKAHLTRTTDYTPTYNVYLDNSSEANNLSVTNYTDTPTLHSGDNTYYVTAKVGNNESCTSNDAKIVIVDNPQTVSDLTIDESLVYLIEDGGTLTVNNALTCDNPARLILEDGAQLVNGSGDVAATVKKNISAASDWGTDHSYTPDGWYFIASPMTSLMVSNSNHTNIASNDYDLYYFDQTGGDNEMEWKNYKNANFNLVNGSGYLYAHSTQIDALFMGTLANPASGEVELIYSEANSSPSMHGWNLVGNPFTYNAYVNKPYYKMSTTPNILVAVENYWDEDAIIAPCTGIMVRSTASGQSATFSQSAPPQPVDSKGSLRMIVAQQLLDRGTLTNTKLDNAIVSFNEGNELEKFYFGTQNANIFIPKGNEEYAIAYSDKQGEIPLNLRVNKNGIYALTVNPEDVELDYLHLIDNLTGNDVDLLVTPNYTFEAKTIDYASRFRLLFAPAEEIEVATDGFAFFADGHLHVFNQGNARLQLIDMTGHILLAETFQENLDKALDLVPGVYVVRLISEKDTRSMKIVVD